MASVLRIILLFVFVDITIAAIFNGSFLDELDNEVKNISNVLIFGETRRQSKKKDRSTSSSGKDKDKSKTNRKTSLEITDSTDDDKPKRPGSKAGKPKSSKERQGWRKWHRKCTPCPEDRRLKWRDPRIKWICGAYQRARRSFKSLCSMHYRNCQDGTMFTKIADHRCQNASYIRNHGEHFFYDYKVSISGDPSSDSQSKSKSKTKSMSGSSSSADSSSESWDSEKFKDFDKNEINVLNNVENIN